MAEVIWGIDMNNSTTSWDPVKRYCRYTGSMCELATDFGYCQLTACIKRKFEIKKFTIFDEGIINE